MKNQVNGVVACLLALLMPGCAGEASRSPGPPDLAGFDKQGAARRFAPETLYEHIDGAAETYLGFGFRELLVQDYAGADGKSVTIEVYRHGSVAGGFGIYSQERPRAARFLEIGAEGYYEPGALNFFQGPDYVKIYGFDLGDADETVLVEAAKKISGAIAGEPVPPRVVTCFPEKGLIAHSTSYVPSGFLGHGFLHSAFVADYETAEGKFRAFIIEASEPAEAEKMLQDYRALVERKGGNWDLDGEVHRFKDPYHASEGTLNLKRFANYIVGLFGDEPSTAGEYLDAMEGAVRGSKR